MFLCFPYFSLAACIFKLKYILKTANIFYSTHTDFIYCQSFVKIGYARVVVYYIKLLFFIAKKPKKWQKIPIFAKQVILSLLENI